MGTFFDADEFRKALDGQGPTVRLFGQDWTCPADIPADIEWRRAAAMAAAVKLMREGKLSDLSSLDDGDDLPDEIADQLDALTTLKPDELYEAYIGRDNLQAWRDRGVGKKVLDEVLRYLIEHHSEGNPTARRTKATASPAG